jgi:hypothetical protein
MRLAQLLPVIAQQYAISVDQLTQCAVARNTRARLDLLIVAGAVSPLLCQSALMTSMTLPAARRLRTVAPPHSWRNAPCGRPAGGGTP